MPKVKKVTSKVKPVYHAVTTRRRATVTSNWTESSLMQRLQNELKLNQSYLSLFLGLVIILITGILVFNFFKKEEANLGPAQQTETALKDVEPGNLPGKYTVKEGDTLFSIAQTYYQDGYKFSSIAQVNKLADENNITAGQVLDIPKIETITGTVVANDLGTGGAVNQTIWGETITGDTYTVVEGDWLSTIAGRAYGDIMAYSKIAQANNISNPNLIQPGMVLTLPR